MRQFLCLILCFSALSCSNDNSRFDARLLVNKAPIDSLKLVPTAYDTLKAGIGFQDLYLDYQALVLNNENLFVGLNNDGYSLDVFSLDSKEGIKTVNYEYEGPNGIVGNMDGFFFHNYDSIFILSMDANTIYLTNDQAEIVNKYPFSDQPLPDGFEDYDAYSDQGMQNGPYYVPSNKTLQFYTYRWTTGAQDDYNYLTFASYSIEDRAFKSVYGIYPDNYRLGNDFLSFDDPNLTVVDTLSFVQFGGSKNIYCYNNATGELLYVSDDHCEHWPSDDIKSLKSGMSDFQKETDWHATNPAYIFLIPNHKDQLLYRFMKNGQPLLDRSGLSTPRWTGPWCITIYDYDLQRLGHSELQKNAFLPIVSFTSDDKLWIKNPNPSDEEGTSLYYTLSLKVNEDR